MCPSQEVARASTGELCLSMGPASSAPKNCHIFAWNRVCRSHHAPEGGAPTRCQCGPCRLQHNLGTMRGNCREEEKEDPAGQSCLISFPPGNSTTGKSPWLRDDFPPLESSQKGGEVLPTLPTTSGTSTSKCRTLI